MILTDDAKIMESKRLPCPQNCRHRWGNKLAYLKNAVGTQ